MDASSRSSRSARVHSRGPSEPNGPRALIRWAVLGLLVVAPLTEVLTGSTIYKLSLTGVALLIGIASWLLSLGEPHRPTPGAAWLCALAGLVLFQLIPLPPGILGI